MMTGKKIIGWISIIVTTSCIANAQASKKLIVPDQFKSIKAAVAEASSGNTVFIKNGVYEEGNIFLPEGVNLIGEGMDTVTIQNDINAGVPIITADHPRGLIKGLTISQTGTTESKAPLAGILLINSSVEIAECRVRNMAGAGIEIKGESKPLVHDCIAEFNGLCGITVWGEDSDPILRNNVCRDNQQQGIYFSESSNGTAKDNVCQDNKNGIMINNKGTSVTLTGNQCRANRGYGIYICGGSHSLAESNICEKNTKTGILVYQKGTTATLKDNQCLENGEDGILFTDAAIGTAENNICKANWRSGISIYNGWAEATLKNNECSENKGNGIWFSGECIGTVENNLCKSNTYNGISSTHKGASPKLTGNKCLKNGGSGIYFGQGAAGIAKDNICNGNKWYGISVADLWSRPSIINNTYMENLKGNIYIEQGEFGPVVTLLAEEKFEDLEQIASRLREEKSRSSTAEWQLSNFYMYLSDTWPVPESSKEDSLQNLINRWIELKPESITPRIVLAKAYVSLAWEARGTGFSDTIMPEMQKRFDENLKMAEKVLLEAENLKDKDPELYNTLMIANFGLGKRPSDVEPIFLKGIGVEKGYHALYLTMANYLQPKWFGGQGEIEEFADKAVNLTREQEGESLYAIVAQVAIPKYSEANPDAFLKFNFSYDRIKKGFEDILQKYPKSDYYLNTYCFVAAIHKDKDTATHLFEEIGANWNQRAWCFESHYKKYYDWAYKDK